MERKPLLLSIAAALLLILTTAGTSFSSALGAPAPATRSAAAASAGCGKAPTLTSGNHTIQSGGQNRSYILRVPAGYDSNHPYRLVFGFHWRGGTANDVDSGGTDGYNWSYYGLRRLADNANNSTIFVAPQGNGNGWANPGGQDVSQEQTYEGRIPHHQVQASSSVDVGQWSIDYQFRYVSKLASVKVPGYSASTIRAGWRPDPRLELAVVAQDLFSDHHLEWPSGIVGGNIEIQRSIYASLTWRR